MADYKHFPSDPSSSSTMMEMGKVDMEGQGVGSICDICGKVFGSITAAKKHSKAVHTKVHEDHQHCPKCDKSYNHMRNFWNHIVLAHETFNRGGSSIGDDVVVSVAEDLKDRKKEMPRGKTETDPEVEALWKMSEDDEPTCIKCNKSYASRDGVRKHIRHVHFGKKRAEKLSPCLKCGKVFVERNRLTKHMKTVHGLSDTDFPCNLCSLVLCSVDGLLRHKKNFHGVDEKPPPSDSPPIQCLYCCEVFQHQGYDAHIRALHSEHYEEYLKSNVDKKPEGKQPTTCEICGETFTVSRVLQRHMARVHNLDGKFQCSECGKSFGDQKELENHMAVHQNYILEPHIKAMLRTVFGVVCQTSLTCGLCQTVVSSSAEGKIHVYIKHPDQYDEMVRQKAAGLVCTVCKERHGSKEDMIQHMEFSHPEEPIPTCGLCGHKELKQREMNFHYKRTHPESQARYNCEVCQESFTQKKELVHHVKRHSDSADQCPYCPERHLKVKSHVTRKHPDRAEEYRKLVFQAIKKEREARKRFNQFLEGKTNNKKRRVEEQDVRSNGDDDDSENEQDLSDNEDDGLGGNEEDNEDEVDMKPIPSNLIVKPTKQVTLEKYKIEKRPDHPHVIEIQRIAQPKPPPVPEPEETFPVNDNDTDDGSDMEVDVKPNLHILEAALSLQPEDEVGKEASNQEAETVDQEQAQAEKSHSAKYNLVRNKELVIAVTRLTESEISKYTTSAVTNNTSKSSITSDNDKNNAPKKSRIRRRRRY